MEHDYSRPMTVKELILKLQEFDCPEAFVGFELDGDEAEGFHAIGDVQFDGHKLVSVLEVHK